MAREEIKKIGDSFLKPVDKTIGALGIPIRLIFTILAWVISIFLIVSMFLFVYNGVTKGEIADKIDIGLTNMGLNIKLANFFDRYYQLVGWDSAKSPETAFGFEGDVEKTESDIGISIEEFSVRSKKVYTNEPIFASAKIDIGKIPSDREIELVLNDACSMEDYQLKDMGTVSAIPSTITLTENMEGRLIDVRCEFPEGITVDGLKGKDQDTKKVSFSPTFTYPNHEAIWYPYTKRFLESKDDIKSPSWGLKEGPAELTIGSSETQPFYEEEKGHIMYVNIKSSWQGYILKINNIEIQTEDDVSLDTNSPYCDFETIGNKYRLKQNKIDEANKDCSKTDVLNDLGRLYKGGSSMTYSECLDKIKKDFTFQCPFTVLNAEEVASKTRIRAKASYIFQMVNAAGVTVYKSLDDYSNENNIIA